MKLLNRETRIKIDEYKTSVLKKSPDPEHLDQTSEPGFSLGWDRAPFTAVRGLLNILFQAVQVMAASLTGMQEARTHLHLIPAVRREQRFDSEQDGD